MYIIAKLPALYGRFNQIKDENYPFRRAFTAYLEALCRLGTARKEDPERLTGFVEDALFPGERLPDLPEGSQPVNFRFSIENPAIEGYFASTDLSNKLIITLFIRLALRLSEEYGTSLPRMTRLVEGLMEPAQDVPEPAPAVRIRPSRKRAPEAGQTASGPVPSVLDRLSALSEKGQHLLEEDEEPAPKEGPVVVQTNPALGDFF